MALGTTPSNPSRRRDRPPAAESPTVGAIRYRLALLTLVSSGRVVVGSSPGSPDPFALAAQSLDGLGEGGGLQTLLVHGQYEPHRTCRRGRPRVHPRRTATPPKTTSPGSQKTRTTRSSTIWLAGGDDDVIWVRRDRSATSPRRSVPAVEHRPALTRTAGDSPRSPIIAAAVSASASPMAAPSRRASRRPGDDLPAVRPRRTGPGSRTPSCWPPAGRRSRSMDRS